MAPGYIYAIYMNISLYSREGNAISRGDKTFPKLLFDSLQWSYVVMPFH